MNGECIKMQGHRVILVAGGAGYIGSHTSKALAEAGYIPVVVDNLSNGHRDSVQWGPFEQGDIGDQHLMRAVLQKYKPLAVINFAGFIEVGESNSNPAKYYQNNVGATMSLLTSMREYGLDKFVFSSTSAVYGTPDTTPIPETARINPLNPYGQTKRMIEIILDDFSNAYKFHSVCLRYFNASGADPSGEIGERHEPETHLIPRALMAAVGKIDGLSLYGDDYHTPDGTCIRDYIHVNDLATAHIMALEYLLNGGTSAKFNVGTGIGTSVKGIISAVEKVTGKLIKVTIHPRRTGDSPILVSDPKLIKDSLGFITKWNSIDEIVESAWNFYSRQWEK
jgi:UDP-arabinose 4-epimerase